MAKAKAKSDIVHFLMPDGTKVSNDPRFVPDEDEAFETDSSLGAKPYKSWKPEELKAEVERRNAGRDEGQKISLQGVKKKSEVVALLQADDAGPHTGAPAPGAQGATPDNSDDSDNDEDE